MTWGLQKRRDQGRAVMLRTLHNTLHSRSESREVPRLSLKELSPLFEIFYRANLPFVLTDWATRWPAFERPWSASRFIDELPDVKIEITQGREGRDDFDRNAHLLRAKTTLGAYAERVLNASSSTNDFYLIARNFALKESRLLDLLNEIDERPFLDPSKRADHAALWFGPKGTFTPLHHDTCNIMFVQCWGEKRFHLLPPHRQDLFKSSFNMYSTIDLKDPPQTEQLTVTLTAGESLFIPIGWWHQVEALTPSTSLAMTHFHLNNQYQWYEPGRL